MRVGLKHYLVIDMATDALIQFNYGDNADLCGLYLRHNASPEDLLPILYDLFYDHDVGETRWNWDYLVTQVIGGLVKDRQAKLLPPSNRNPEDVIYHYVITPTINYAKKETPIGLVISVNVNSGHGETAFKGLLSSYSAE